MAGILGGLLFYIAPGSADLGQLAGYITGGRGRGCWWASPDHSGTGSGGYGGRLPAAAAATLAMPTGS